MSNQVRVLHQPAHQQASYWSTPPTFAPPPKSDPQKVALVMDGGLRQEVEGDLKSVWEALTGEKAAL